MCLITLANKTYLQVFLNFTLNSSAACTTYPMNEIYFLLVFIHISKDKMVITKSSFHLSRLSCSQSLHSPV